MMIGVSQTADGTDVLIIGLEPETITQLMNDQPVSEKLSEHPEFATTPLAEWELWVLGPENLAQLELSIGAGGKPE